MLIELRVQNFRSYRTEQTLNLVASNYDKSLPENVMALDLPGLGKISLVKAVALYGPNAGGKSNILRGLRYMSWLVQHSATGLKPNQSLPEEGFLLDSTSHTDPTVLEAVIVAEGVRYELSVAVTRERVMQERLVAYPLGRAQVWYDRTWDEELNRYEWAPQNPVEFVRDAGIVGKTRPNSLFLSVAAQWNNEQVMPVYRWFADRLKFLDLGADGRLDHEFTAKIVAHSESNRRRIASLLRSADVGLVDVEVREEDVPRDVFRRAMEVAERELGQKLVPESQWSLTFRHKGAGGEGYSMGHERQSAGTLRFFSLMGPIIDLVRNQLVAGIDEFDTSLHPTLAAEALRLLFASSIEQPGAQLLFTTHNPLLLDTTLLRRDQIWFADKDEEGASFLYPLTDYKPRQDESLVRGYMSGRYGAVPFIPRGLLAEAEPEVRQPVQESVHAS